MTGSFHTYEEALLDAQPAANAMHGRTAVGIEKRLEYGRTVYTVKLVPWNPDRRQGHELRLEIVHPMLKREDGHEPGDRVLYEIMPDGSRHPFPPGVRLF